MSLDPAFAGRAQPQEVARGGMDEFVPYRIANR